MLRLSTSIAKSGDKVGIGTQNVLLMRHGQANTCRELAGVIGIPTCNGAAPAEVAKPRSDLLRPYPRRVRKKGEIFVRLGGLVGRSVSARLLHRRYLIGNMVKVVSISVK